jgi:hypothetical protein
MSPQCFGVLLGHFAGKEAKAQKSKRLIYSHISNACRLRVFVLGSLGSTPPLSLRFMVALEKEGGPRR